MAEHPEDLKSKLYLLKHFERYIMDRLYGNHDYIFDDLDRIKGMDFVQKYLRMKHVIVFKLSHDVLQFNFFDHSKLILSSNGLLVTHIDKSYALTRYSLAEVMETALKPPHPDPEQAKSHQRVLAKLNYAKEILTNIKTAQQKDASESNAPAHAPGHARVASLASHSSKGSLR